MNKREAAIITAYTGIYTGNLSEFHSYAGEKFGHPIFTHEMADTEFLANLKELCREDFMALFEGITNE